MDSDEDSKQSPAEQIYYLYKIEEEKKAEAKNKQRLNNVKAALLVAVVYIIVYLVGRFIWCDFSQSSFIGWLFTIRPSGEHSYLYGWLLNSNLFWYAMAISMIPALLGKSKFSLVATAAFMLGIIFGMIFGPYPEGAAIGHNHYGWAIWGGIYLISIIVGILAERFIKSDVKALFSKKKRGPVNHYNQMNHVGTACGIYIVK